MSEITERLGFVLRTGMLALLSTFLIGCSAPSLPWSQQSVPTIGFLATGTRDGRAFLVDGFLQGLREHGYIENQNILIEYRFSDTNDDQLPALAEDLVSRNVRIIVASGTPASFAAARATTTIPIVMGSLAADPVETGLIDSIARPGRNITGMTSISARLSAKRLELLKETLPNLEQAGVFWNPPNPTYGPVLKEFEAAAPALGLTLQRLEVRVPSDLEGAFEAAARAGLGAIVAPADPLTTNRPKMMADLSLKHRVPTLMERREFVEAGGLMSLGADLADLYRRSALYVHKILNSANPAELPMEQPTALELFINLSTANSLGMNIPPSVLQQATEILP
jgi:putative tryptophan/tyrosine transport system substrate-binding protein